jgi:hypothetical protein
MKILKRKMTVAEKQKCAGMTCASTITSLYNL